MVLGEYNDIYFVCVCSQCDGLFCRCLDAAGQQIGDNYFVAEDQRGDMSCSCARDKAAGFETKALSGNIDTQFEAAGYWKE